MDDFIKMYNATLKYIKTKHFNKEKCTFSFRRLRTDELKDIKEEIIQMGKNIQSVMENIIPLSMEANANEMRTKHTNNRSSPRIRK